MSESIAGKADLRAAFPSFFLSVPVFHIAHRAAQGHRSAHTRREDRRPAVEIIALRMAKERGLIASRITPSRLGLCVCAIGDRLRRR
ncbi:hypothetical protein [Sinorhizobium sp. BJ1]|uniref:hypothetical protein n=1 Tax=Sinorhizobium sp. BJ1 TaxID=2035455 RepID=UPI00118527EF|nr:hypothetical protein [Sinorhizobium sp. BJ1]